jgi:hypothetical protein
MQLQDGIPITSQLSSSNDHKRVTRMPVLVVGVDQIGNLQCAAEGRLSWRPLSFKECDNIFIGRETKRAERRAYCIGDVGWGHVPVMLFNHARIRVAELMGNHRQRSTIHD